MALLASPRVASGAAVRLRHLSLVALAAAGLVTCTAEPTSPSRPGVGTLRVTPFFDAYARLVPLTLDNVRVIVVRPPSDVLLTATRSFSPSTQQLTLSLPVLLQATSEALQVTLELYAGTTLLFRGTSTVQVAAGGTTAPASVPVSYQGPGATLATLTLAPRDTTVSLGASFPFTATALDAQQATVPQFYVSWSADNGGIDAAGGFTAPGARDTVMVHAVTPNGVEDSTRVIVTAAPSTLTRVGGDGQSGIVGTRLPQPLAVQVNGTDGQPVPGAVVAFTVTTGGGSVDSALATSDAQGIARSGAVLGPTVGAQSFTATVSGIPAAVFTATATGVAPIVVTLAAGESHTCEIRGTQTLCWGDNSVGQLGDGTTTTRAVPGPVATAQTFVSLALGAGHSCALTAAGQAFCWGENFSGSLGDGTTTNSPTPVAVGGGRTFVALSAGEEFTCGLTSAGQAFCWGLNFDGQLGDGTNTDRLLPTAVTGGLSFTGLDAGVDHTCALTAAGPAFCWGSNFDGQLGDGTLVSTNVPTAVTGGLSFSAVHAGFNFSCGIATGGAGFCWGINFGLQLTSPQPVAGGFTYTALAGGDNHLCGLTTGGWRCGGDNGSGQLGDGSTTDRVSPVLPSGGFTFTALAGGAQHTCGRTSSGTRCWGSNTVGQLGDGTTTDQLTPTLTVGPATTAQVSAGNTQTASAGTAVPIAPAIVVRDALNNPVPGLDVLFAVTSGGGALTGALTQTNALGIATVGSWTLGATPGTNTLSATVPVGGVSGNPVSFTATGTAPSVVTWDGSASTVWTDPNNWTPALVPTAAQDVVIPSGTPNQPSVTTTASTQSLTIQSGATLTLNGSFTFNVFGDFDNAGLIALTAGTPTLDLRGTTRTMRGNTPVATSVSGSYTLTGAVTVANSLSLSGGTASLTVGGQLLSVSSLSVGSGGSLVMTNPADVVVVSGNVTMGGSDHTGKLTAGQIQVQGNFLQTSGGSPNSYAASGTHTTVITGFGSVSFQSPNVAASRFQNLIVQGNPVNLATRMVAAGDVTVTGGLALNIQTFEVLGDFSTAGAGTITMSNAADSLIVAGNATFGGGSTVGKLTAGTFVLSGNLTEAVTGGFRPSGNNAHFTVLNGTSLQTLQSSQVVVFDNLDVSAASGGIQLATFTGTLNQLISLPSGAPPVISGPAGALGLNPNGVNVNGLVINGTDMQIGGPGRTITRFDNVSFQNQAAADTQLVVFHPGVAGGVTFNNISFGVTPTGAGVYLVADDEATGDGIPLTINMVGAAPSSPSGLIVTRNGAVINWPAVAPVVTWTGLTSTNWNTATNWSSGAVPTSANDVVIPSGTPNSPSVTAGCLAKTLTVNTGATLSLNGANCQVQGDVIADGAISLPGSIQMQGAGFVRGNLPNLIVTAGVTLNGPTSLAGSLTITGVGASLTIGGNALTVSALLSVQGAGLLVMNNPSDVVTINGDATFDGGNELGQMSEGLLSLGGDLTQSATSSGDAFHPSGNHTTFFTSNSPSVAFATPGLVPGTSHFQGVVWTGTGTMTLGSDVYVHDFFQSASLSPVTISGGNRTLTAGVLLNGAPITFDNVQLTLDMTTGSPIVFNDLTFQNMDPTASQLDIRHPGTSGPFTANNLSFSTVPSTGTYITALDTDGATPVAFTLNLTNPTPPTDGGFIQELNGAVINWPTSGPGVTWLGTASTDWNAGANWSGGTVPTSAQDVTIPSGTPFSPIVTTSCAARSLNVNTGATLDLAFIGCTVQGDVIADGAITGLFLDIQGAGNVRGNLPGETIINAAVTVIGPTTVNGRLLINGTGALTVNGQSLDVAQHLLVSASGVLVMTNPADVVTVAANSFFGGGDETGKLTAGLLRTANLVQTVGTSSASFAASGTHVVELPLQNAAVSMQSGGTGAGSSHIQDLVWSGTGGILFIQSGAAYVLGTTTVTGGVRFEGSGGTRLFHTGRLVSATPLEFLNAQLWLEPSVATPISLSNVTFTLGSGFTPLVIRHPGLPAGGKVLLDQLTFTNVPTSPAVYLDVDDTAPGDGNPLVVDVTNSTPSSPSGLVLATNGATINWPAAAPGKTWLGATQDWHTTTNWSPAGVPTATDDVVIGGAPNQPILSANATARNVTVQTGFLLNLNSFTLAVTGDVSAPIGTSFIGGGGVLQLNGPANTLSGNLSSALSVTVNGGYTLAGRTTIGALTVAGTGDLAINGNTLVVGGALNTTGSGTITMINALDSVLVTGAGIFGGGDEAGKLTAGYLKIGGSFNQTSGTSPSSFAANRPHKTELGAAAVRVVTFATPGQAAFASHFGDLEVSTATGGLTFNSGIVLEGELISQPPGATPLVGGAPTPFLLVDGLRVNGLIVDNAQITTTGVLPITQFDNVTIQNVALGDALAINDPGRLSPYVFNNISFTTVPAGNYIFAADLAQADGVVLTIDMVNPTPATASGKTFVAGAVINWPATAPAAQWDGTVSFDWNTAANWSTGSVPGPTTDVTIPAGTPFPPLLSAPAVVGALTVHPTASLGLAGFTLTVNGLLDVLTATVTGFPGSRIVMAGTGVGMQGSVAVDVTITGSATLFNTFDLGGSLLLQGSLNLNGTSLLIGGDLTTQGASALIIMQNGGEFLSVAGNATFDGGNQLGSMTTGQLQLSGNLTQLNTHSGDSFHPSGGHVTNLLGTAPTLTFATPGDVPGTSHFQFLAWGNTGTLTLASDVYAHNALTFGSFGGNTVISSGNQLSVGRVVMFNGATVTFDNTRLVINPPSVALPIDFDHVTFQNMDPTVTQLTVLHTGTGGPFQFSDMTFSTTPTGPGLYLHVTDTDGGAPLTINMTNPNPAAPGGFAQAVNGAVINWPAGGPVIAWNGSVDSDWFNTANWNGGVVPGAADNVLIPSGMPNYPDAPNIDMNDLTIQLGASLSTSDHTITVGGNLDVSGLISGCCQVTMTGTSVTARGNLDGYTFRVEPGAVVSLNGTLGVGGQFNDRIEINGGELVINGHTAIAAELQVFNGGLLTMTNPADLVAIETLSQFAGGDETGRLTSGLFSTGDFTQAVGTSAHATSFVASGTHQTVLSGSSPSIVQFQNPGTSHFENLAVGSAAGSVTLNSDVTATGVLNGILAVSILAGTPGVTLTAGGAFVQGLTFDGVPLVLSGGPIVGFNTVTFQNMDPAVTQFTVSNDGSGGILSFDGLSFLTTPTTGLYLVVNDVDGPSPVAFTLNLTNATPASPGSFSQANNGAVLTWNGVGAGGLSWSGGTSSDWSTASNWSTGVVPTSSDDVVIPAGTPNQPQLTSNSVVGGITLQPGADLDLNGFTLTASGDVDAGNTISGAGTFIAAGAGVTLKGTVAALRVTGTAAFSGVATVTGSLTVDGAGADLNVNGQVATVGGGLFIQNNATLTMTAPGGSLSIAGNANFAGASTAGRLTDGVLSIAGSFDQSGADPQSFQASGNHLTILNGVAPSITFATPGTGTASRFHRLQISTGGSALMNSRVTVGSNAVISAGALNPGGHTLDIGGDLSTAVTGTLIMQNGADSVIVAGAALFDGGNESGLLTAGVLRTSGLFRQFSSNSPSAFVASGTHTTELAFFNPTTNLILISSPASSGFQNLRVLTGVSFSSDIPVKGDLDVQVNSPTNLLGGALIVTGNFNQNGTAFFGPDRLELGGTFARAGAGGFSPDTLILTGLSPQALAFSIPEIVYNTLIVRSDATINGGQVNTLSDVEVQTGGILRVGGNTLVVGGDLGTSGSGVLQMVSTTDSIEVTGAATFAGGSEFGLLTAGVLNVKGDLIQLSTTSNRSYAPTGTHRTRLTGTVPQTVNFASPGSLTSEPRELTIDNTSPGGVTFTDAHLIFGGVTLNGTSTLNALATFNVSGGFTAGPGTTVNATDLGLLSGPLSVSGTFNADTLTAVGLNPIPVLPYKTLRLAQVTSPLAPGAAYSITGSLLLTFGGSLRLNGSSLNVAADLIVGTSGSLIMDDPADVLSVAGDATFDGADETGKLTAGVLRVGGNFTQDSTTSTTSFLSTGTDLVLDGSGSQSVSFASLTAKLAGLTIAKSAGTVDISKNVFVSDSLLVSSPTTIQGSGYLLVTRKVITAAASTLAMYGLSVIPDSLQVGGTFAVFQADFGAGTTIPALPYRQLVIYGGDLTFAGPASIDTALIIVNPGTRLTLPAGGSVNGRVLMTNASQLVLGPATLTVQDSLSLGIQGFPSNGGGTIVMQDPSTILDVGRNVYLEGGNSTGLLTAGTLKVGGDFVVSNVISPLAFMPSGTHTTVFTNTAPATMSLTGSSRFQDLDLSQATGGRQLLTSATVVGTLTSTGSGVILSGSGADTLTVIGGSNVSALTLDNVPLVLISTAAALALDGVTFQNFNPTLTQLAVSHPGPGGPFTFNSLNFTTMPTTGFHIKATDINGLDGTPLQINMVNPSPIGSAALIQLLGGAGVTWP